MEVNKPLVSVIIPAFNSLKYICQAIDSCLQQTYPHIEIIIVDDGSTDGTTATLSAHYGNQVQIITQENSGPSIARNRGIEAAKGEYVKFLDSDDMLYPTFIECCLEAFACGDVRVGMVYTRFQDVDAQGQFIRKREDIPLLDGDVFCNILLSNGTAILPSATMIRRDALYMAGLFPHDATFRHGEDWDLFLRLAQTYHFKALDEVLVDYRIHEQNQVRNNYANAAGRLRVLENADAYPRTYECLSRNEYNKLLAVRYHIVAIELWKLKRREDARYALHHAIRLAPHSAQLRRLYLIMTYFLPEAIVRWFNQLIRWVKSS